jgi:hypothetical protein
MCLLFDVLDRVHIVVMPPGACHSSVQGGVKVQDPVLEMKGIEGLTFFFLSGLFNQINLVRYSCTIKFTFQHV